MDNAIIVSPDALKEKSDKINTSAEKIKTLYSEMQQEINKTLGRMKGDGAKEFEDAFKSMQRTFDMMSDDIKAYSDFLKLAADNYLEVDASAVKLADRNKVN